jgi:hypothetical protein
LGSWRRQKARSWSECIEKISKRGKETNYRDEKVNWRRY